jgi:hypothetical protein
MRKKPKINSRLYFAIAGILLFFVALVFRRYIFYALLFIGSSSLHYFLYTKELKINIGHVFFFSMLIARSNLMLAIAFLIVSGFLSEAFAGYLEAKTFVAYPIFIAAVSVSVIFAEFSMFFVGIIFTLLTYGMVFIGATAVSEPLPEKILEIIIPLGLNLVYFISFAEPAMELIKILT